MKKSTITQIPLILFALCVAATIPTAAAAPPPTNAHRGFGNETYCINCPTTQPADGDTISVDVTVEGVDAVGVDDPESLVEVTLYDDLGGSWPLTVSGNSASGNIT